ncbi:unnamed protein product [Nezara viridula]|uniref:Uncharacterized protein n=1 Tax=Nezara viridula TaxID=85310 RepID=A0A9P0HMD7_NEZVI|nr:unnamed protein product [Nezara viridula]
MAPQSSIFVKKDLKQQKNIPEFISASDWLSRVLDLNPLDYRLLSEMKRMTPCGGAISPITPLSSGPDRTHIVPAGCRRALRRRVLVGILESCG